eukprot:1984266-Prymnesium_polylepis.1
MFSKEGRRSSWHGAKIVAFRQSPFEHSVYLDSDTFFCDDDVGATLRRGFALMGDEHHVGGVFQLHLHSQDDLNAGVIFWKRSATTRALWEAWEAGLASYAAEMLAPPCRPGYQTECDASKTASGMQEVLVADQ